MAFIAFRTNDAVGINIRPGKEGAPSADLLSGIKFISDDYGDYLQLRFTNDGAFIPSSDLGGNDDKLLSELERYLDGANTSGRMRLSIRPDIEDQEDAAQLFFSIAEKFMARRADAASQ